MRALDAVVPPPAQPAAACGDWDEVEAVLEIALPADYKELIGRYGLGRFADFLAVLTPFGMHGGLTESAGSLLENEQPSRDANPEAYPHPLFPEAGGLLQWAYTVNDDRLCWLTDGEPATWPVVVWNQRDAEYELHAMSAAEFLAGWLDRSIVVSSFPSGDWTCPVFEPFRERVGVDLRLTEGALPYAERLRILRDALAPTTDRGVHGKFQFASTDRNWLLSYDGSRLVAIVPPMDKASARTHLARAAGLMGCSVLRTCYR